MLLSARPCGRLLIFMFAVVAVIGAVYARGCVGSMEEERSVDEIIAAMSLEQKIGQLVMAGIEGSQVGPDARLLIGDRQVGGIILFRKNMQTPEQTRQFIARLQELNQRSGSKVGLLVATDQEGGIVEQIDFATDFPGNMALGATGDPVLAERQGKAIGRELAGLGINLDLAPVMDVNNSPANPVIGVRSFGSDPKLVASLGTAFLKGLRDVGIGGVAKHFPGHGDTAVDSHVDLPSIPHGRERLRQVELVPFAAAIAAGVDAIMTAHITVPQIEPEAGIPATLSPSILTGLLREEMGYNGVIMTDALEMGAIRNHFGLGEAAVRSIEAGADIVLVAWPADWYQSVTAVDALRRAVSEGRLSEERIDQSVARILALKGWLGLLGPDRQRPAGQEEVEQQEAKQQEHLNGPQLAREIAERSITVVRDEPKWLPLRRDARLLLVTPALKTLGGDEGGSSVKAALSASFASVEEIQVPLRPASRHIQEVAQRSRQFDAVVVCTYRAYPTYLGQGELVEKVSAELRRQRKPLVAVALREPYDIMSYPEVECYVATYGWRQPSLEALSRVLSGEIPAKGQLPVTIPGIAGSAGAL